MKKNKDLPIKRLLEAKKLTSWAFNVCQSLNLKEVDELLSYYDAIGNFFGAPSCGAKINEELIRLCKKLKNNSDLIYQALNMVSVPENMFKNKLQLKKMDFFVRDEIEKLSTRARNTLRKYSKSENVGLQEIYDIFELNNGMITFPFAAGVKTEKELVSFVKDCLKTYAKVSKEKVTDTDIRIQEIKDITGINLSKDPDYLSSIKAKRFILLQFVWENYPELFSLSTVDNDIFRNYLAINKKRLTLSEIGDKYDLTNERIRQRRNDLISFMDSKAGLVKDLALYSNIRELMPKDQIIKVEEKLVKKVSPSAKVDKIPNAFAAFILYLLNIDKYFLLGPGIKLKRPFRIFNMEYYAEHKMFKTSYLISKDIFDREEFLSIINKAIEIQASRLVSQKSLDLNDFYPGLDNPKKINVLKTILSSEFGIDIINKKIVFEKNRDILNTDMIYDALKKIGEPAHITQVMKEIRKENKTITFTETSVRYYLVYFKERFIFFGRSSTYGLKEWESKFKNIKGGTIREMVIEFLQDNPGIHHIDEIAKFVTRYRETDGEKILANLKLDTKRRFLFHKGNNVSLVANTKQ